MTMRGLDIKPERPNGVLVFAGPPNVGKSTMARAIAEHLFDALDRVLTIEMAQFQEEHTIHQLIGSPPGYVGYDEGGRLDWVNDVRCGVIVLDNLHIAHPNIIALFEQIFDTGVITNMRHERLFFSDVIFVITCDIRTQRSGRVGFQAVGQEDISVERQVRELLGDALLDRVDAVCPFYPLSLETVERIIATKLLPALLSRAQEEGIFIEVAPDVASFLARQVYSPEQGMHRADAAVQRIFMNPVLEAADAARSSECSAGARVSVTVCGDCLVAVLMEEGD
ncbi:MAG: ATP-dependent Clp protease ATP-binding subunit [Armatimonadetes bacterium]|nr:ATP-dependent Clp protease ATP-binding subunit [Armatimonadota bacterium]